MVFVGVDFHKYDFLACYRVNEDEQTIRSFRNDVEGIGEFIGTLSCQDEVAIESMGIERHFAKVVRAKVKTLLLVNTAQYKVISQSPKKTDKRDAEQLAWGLEKRILPAARFRSEEAIQVRSILNVRDMMVSHRVAILNRFHAICCREGQPIPAHKMRYKVWRNRVLIERFEFGDKVAWQLLESQLTALDRDIRQVDQALLAAVKNMEGYDVLESIPYLGPISTAYILAYIDGVQNFKSAKALCAYFGIVPTTRLSGGKVSAGAKFGRFKSGTITRQGDRKTRSVVTLAMRRLLAQNESLRDFYEKIKGRKGYRKALTAAARKFLMFLFYALKRGGPIEDFAKVDFSRPHLK